MRGAALAAVRDVDATTGGVAGVGTPGPETGADDDPSGRLAGALETLGRAANAPVLLLLALAAFALVLLSFAAPQRLDALPAGAMLLEHRATIVLASAGVCIGAVLSFALA